VIAAPRSRSAEGDNCYIIVTGKDSGSKAAPNLPQRQRLGFRSAAIRRRRQGASQQNVAVVLFR
jgi:hypothetical protein